MRVLLNESQFYTYTAYTPWKLQYEELISQNLADYIEDFNLISNVIVLSVSKLEESAMITVTSTKLLSLSDKLSLCQLLEEYDININEEDWSLA